MDIYSAKVKEIKNRWKELRDNEGNSQLRIRDAAELLGYSEAQLLSTKVSDTVSFLKIKDIHDFLIDIKKLNKIMILSRNEIAVHEKIIETANVRILRKEKSIFILADNFELEIDETSFKYAFAESSDHGKNKLHSFQFFDDLGNSVLKIYLKSDLSDIYSEILLKYQSIYNYELQRDDSELINNDTTIFKNFHSTLSKFKKIEFNEKGLLRSVLEECSSKGIDSSIIVLGPASIQKYNGMITKIVDYKGWLNILDNSFNLHIQDQKISDIALLYINKSMEHSFYISFFDNSDNLVLSISTCTELTIFNKVLVNQYE